MARKRKGLRRAGRCAKQRQAGSNLGQARWLNILIDNYSVRPMVVDRKRGGKREAEVVGVYQPLGCDTIGLQETLRSGQIALFERGMWSAAAVRATARGAVKRA